MVEGGPRLRRSIAHSSGTFCGFTHPYKSPFTPRRRAAGTWSGCSGKFPAMRKEPCSSFLFAMPPGYTGAPGRFSSALPVYMPWYAGEICSEAERLWLLPPHAGPYHTGPAEFHPAILLAAQGEDAAASLCAESGLSIHEKFFRRPISFKAGFLQRLCLLMHRRRV